MKNNNLIRHRTAGGQFCPAPHKRAPKAVESQSFVDQDLDNQILSADPEERTRQLEYQAQKKLERQQ
jgi:hypothetical protein